MCNKISSDLVIGNIFIEAVEKDIEVIDINMIIKFEESFNNKLEENNTNCYANILLDEIYDLVNTYSNILNIDEGKITFKFGEEKKETIIDKLLNFFRIGLPTLIINMFTNISNEVFA